MRTIQRIINVPLSMEDELLYSYIGRIADANGVSANVFAQAVIYDPNKEERTKIPYGAGAYYWNLLQWMNVNPLEFFLKTSLYPGYAPLLRRNEQNGLINIVFRGRRTFPGLITNRHSDIAELNYCPHCSKEDFQNKGFSWFRRAHHMPGVKACYKHGITLQSVEKTAVKYSTIPIDPPDTETASKIEVDYAIFAKEFLDAALDTCADTLKRIMGAHFQEACIDQAVSKYGSTSVEELLGQDVHKFFKAIMSGNVYKKPERLLKALFIIFSSVSSIPSCIDRDLLVEFSQACDEYEVFSPFTLSAVLMRKRDSEDLFVTTPDAFIAGWRDPRDDIGKSEEIKFEELLNNVKHGEYRLLTPFIGLNKMVDLYHERCKEVYTVRAKAVLEEGSDCKCKQRYLEADVREAVEKDGIFQLLEFDNATKRLTIYGRECGHTFDVSLRAWNMNSECRICQKERFNDKQTSWFGSRKHKKTQEDFDRQIRDLVGDEYRVVSEYYGYDVPVTFLHIPCNQKFDCRPIEFVRGRRCSCRKLPGQKEFIKYVSERSSGQYECEWNRVAKRYTVIDTNTGEIVGTWKKDLIVQELERPTPSPILPLKEKGAYELPEKKTIVDSVKQYLQCHYLREEHFSLEDIKIDGLTLVQIRHALDRAAKQNVVKKMGNKQYVYLG